MMNYLMRYKGQYRVLPTLDQRTNDFVREHDGSICDNDIYIDCRYGNKIFYYGLDQSRRAVLEAYIPSKQRGHNICNKLNELQIPYFNYCENDKEIMFRFKAKDIEPITELMSVKTGGASISPFSSKNLPKRKDIVLPAVEVERYRQIANFVEKEDLLILHRITQDYLEKNMQRTLRKTEGKKFTCKADMLKMMLSRQPKEYIYVRGFWDDYLKYFNKQVDSFYKEKNK